MISNCTRSGDGDTVGISKRVAGIQHLSRNRCATDADLSSWLVIDWCHIDRDLPHGFDLAVKGRQLKGHRSMEILGWNAGEGGSVTVVAQPARQGCAAESPCFHEQ